MEGYIIDGRYEISKMIGYGGNAEVYEGKDMESEEKIAAKFEDVDKGNIITEYNAYTMLSGTVGIPKVYHYETYGRYNILIMELMGEMLENILAEQLPIPFSLKISFAKQLLQTLKNVHSSGIVHYDLKPSNIMTGAGIKNNIIHIVDFGSAQIYDKDAIDGNGTIKWLQQRDEYNLVGVILDMLNGLSKNSKNEATSVYLFD